MTATNEIKKEYPKELFTLWKKKTEKGLTYFTGKTSGGQNIIAFYNVKKQNPNEPDMKIFLQVEKDEKLDKPIASLWCNVSSKGNKYLTGSTNKTRITGFINTQYTEENNLPYLRIYLSDDLLSNSEETKERKEAKANVDAHIDDLPF